MPKASEFIRQGRNEELWQMCCGYIDLDIDEFMEIQERLLIQQLDLLNNCELGRKIMRGASPKTLEEFRRMVPLTTYKDYVPELTEKMEDTLPEKPVLWARSSGRSGDYPCKWIPLTKLYMERLSISLFGVGTFAAARRRGDINVPYFPRVLYSVAPKPYISGTFADSLNLITNVEYLPDLKKAEKMTYEDRTSLGFQQALYKGIDFFFGLSLVLVKVGEKLAESSGKVKITPYLKHPRGLLRLLQGLIKSKLARRPLMPRDIWKIKGIIGSGIDSWVYKEKIQELWGRKPLDLYSSTEGGVIASQTWDYNGMTFIPGLNFFEFISEEEQLKNQMDRTYQPETLLLNELKAGETYEIVLTSFHGGAMVRYRIGDVIRITSLTNETLGIKLPQMAFERRADGIIDFNVVRLTEKMIWEALEESGVKYQDWIAYRVPGNQVLDLYIEMRDGYAVKEKELESFIYKKIIETYNIDDADAHDTQKDALDMLGFSVKIHLLEKGFFLGYSLKKQKEGADLAHIKPPHINPRGEILSLLQESDIAETIVIKKSRNKTASATESEKEKISA